MAGTYYKPGRVIDTSISDLTKGVQDVEKALKEQAKLRKIEEENRINRINKINEGEYGLSSSINEFPEYAEVTLDDEIKLGLQNQLEKVHQLGIDSIGKDNNEYLKAKRELEVAAKEAGLFMSAFNEQGKVWDKNRGILDDQPGSYLNSTDLDRVSFIDDYTKGGSNIKPELVNGVWMFTKKGVGGEDYVVNSRAFLTEENDFIEYTESIDPIAKTIYDTHAVKYQKEKEKILKKYEGGDGTIITETFDDWKNANEELRRAINSDPALLTTLNSKTFQSIPLKIRGKEFYDPASEEQKKMYIKYIEDKIMADFAEEGRTRTALSTDSTKKSNSNNNNANNSTSKVDFKDIEKEGASIEKEIKDILKENEKLKDSPFLEEKKEQLAKKLQEKLVKEFKTMDIKVGSSTKRIEDVFVDIEPDGSVFITPTYINDDGVKINIEKYPLNKLDQLKKDLLKIDKEYVRTSEDKNPTSGMNDDEILNYYVALNKK